MRWEDCGKRFHISLNDRLTPKLQARKLIGMFNFFVPDELVVEGKLFMG